MRKLLEERYATALISSKPENQQVAKGGFAFYGGHLMYLHAKTLCRSTFHKRSLACQWVAH